MDGRTQALAEKLERLLAEAAEAAVALDRANGTIQGVPHYSVIELRAHELGCQLSRGVQERQMRELAAVEAPRAPCPGCGQRCELLPKKRTVGSIDGSVELTELVGRCPFCRKFFFPASPDVGVRCATVDAAVGLEDGGFCGGDAELSAGRKSDARSGGNSGLVQHDRARGA